MKRKLIEKLPENWQESAVYLLENKPQGFVFAMQSDSHFAGNNDEIGNNINTLSKIIDLEFYAHLGDIIRGYEDPVLDAPENMRECMDEMVRRYLNQAVCPVLMTIGNHDTNVMWYDKFGDEKGFITEIEHYDRVMKPLKEYNGEKMVINGRDTYYYMDFEKHNIRVIMLNTINQAFSKGIYKGGFIISEEQIEWFKNEALNTDKQIIVMSHTPLSTVLPKNNCSQNSEIIRGEVEKFIKRGGKFIAYFCGHVHEQYAEYDENGRLHISNVLGCSRCEVVSINTDKREINTTAFGTIKSRIGLKY